MDYVVAGFGIGAILALVGFALWELFGSTEQPGRTWLGRTSIGSMLGSLVIWAVTGVTLFSDLDDSTSSRLVLLTTLVTLLVIGAASLWYRRAERALLVSSPRATDSRPPVTSIPAPVASPVPPAAIEPSEWDTWPDRAIPAGEAEVAAAFIAPSFEPEVAAEPLDTPIVFEAAVEHAADEHPASPVDDAAGGAAERSDSDEPYGPSEPESPLVDEIPSNAERGLPENVLAFRPKEPLESIPSELPPDRPDIEDDSADEPETDRTQVAGPAGDETVEPIDIPVRAESETRSGPAAFESSLLADIDSSAVEGDGRYRSPLLADLESNADELEGIGLAKWRPEDRLTAEGDTDAPSRPISRRHH